MKKDIDNDDLQKFAQISAKHVIKKVLQSQQQAGDIRLEIYSPSPRTMQILHWH